MMDQLVNQAAENVLHVRWQGPRAYGDAGTLRRHQPRCTARPESGELLHPVPGLKVICPSTPYDAKG